ncbi:MAG: SsrA-binding protein SmpB [Actinomycetaceae bacterium]|nr:SsrA-binding protein SmpB [Actinomycetaceae bacterium]
MIARNRRATHDYFIEDRVEAGLVLMGTEVKALRMGRASLQEAWIEIDDNLEAWLHQAHIPAYIHGSWTNHTPLRKRKLLLHRKEIVKLSRKIQAKGYTIVPLELYFRLGRVKILIGVGRGKQEYDKRHALREAQDKREARRAIHRYAKGYRE